ncbi:hypothetical protein GCM10027034_38310 [Ramlibacter solisilvae]|uniref:Uncharacterized protein n=1 Tax=Ramlibacter tataouinensis TaxID=94132 RepID=A0A127JZR2_9BURK|nr:hypothetical protein [Ramlibacter tataouinensis]AMO23622.1 hypothetical protein UC35_12905 [Ramlibacter tataouinensis]
MSRQKPRILHPQPPPDDEEQAPAAAGDAQGAPGAKQQMGEGSYEGTRDYNQRTADYLKKADVEADAKAAKPKSDEEARELKRAEDEGRSHSKGEH